MKINEIQKVVQNGLCTGCGLCASVLGKNKIKIEFNQSGYLRPRVVTEITAKDQDEFLNYCPGITLENNSKEQYHPIWGPLLKVRTCYATDPIVRRQGSSGGGISALLIFLLKSQRVDCVAQIGTSIQSPILNDLQVSMTPEDVIAAAGSRYSPSSPLSRLHELLATGKKIAYVGKPCDIAALRRYVNQHPQYKAQIPYMLSFMCAGIPSQLGTDAVLKKLGAEKSKVTHFRYRGDGWPGMAKATQSDGQVFEMDYNSSWGTILNKYLQFRCKICPDGTGESADIVCADAWYGKDGYPDFAERDGRSLLLTRTQQGEELVLEAVKAQQIAISDLAVEEIAKMQPYQVDRKQMVLGRVVATKLALGVAPKYKRMGLLQASMQSNPLTWLRSAYGTFRRAKGEQQ